MEALTFFSAMNRGQFREEQGIEGSSYCIFFAPMEELVTQDRMTGREDQVVLELLYGDEMLPGALRVRQVGSNAVVEESTQGAFRAFLEEKPVKYIGQLLMYALQFKIQDLSLRIEGCTVIAAACAFCIRWNENLFIKPASTNTGTIRSTRIPNISVSVPHKHIFRVK